MHSGAVFSKCLIDFFGFCSVQPRVHYAADIEDGGAFSASPDKCNIIMVGNWFETRHDSQFPHRPIQDASPVDFKVHYYLILLPVEISVAPS